MTKANSHFKRGSGVFKCRNCKRSTRDTTGDNGDVLLCEDCYEGCMWENGGNDATDEATRADCFARADAHFQNAVNKGGTIEGFKALAGDWEPEAPDAWKKADDALIAARRAGGAA